MAYVGTYTHGSSIGIHLYDIDVEEGTLSERKVVKVNNSSHICRSLNGKYLYSIADEGVEVFKVEEDGDLTPINKIGIDGMRGCYLSVDQTGKYLLWADTMTERLRWCIPIRTEGWAVSWTACSTRAWAVWRNGISAPM